MEENKDQEVQEAAKEDKESATQGQETPEEKIKLLEEKVSTLEKERDEIKDRLLRKAADFDNYRKRMIKEKADAYTYANEKLLTDLLESLDNFDRTIKAGEGVKEAKALVDGVNMINKNLKNLLENKYELVAFAKEGEEFNPNLHEALQSVEGEVEAATIKEVYLKGYKLKERVLRHAKVLVVTPKSVKEGSEEKGEENKEEGKEN